MKVINSAIVFGAGRRSDRSTLEQLVQLESTEHELCDQYSDVFARLLESLLSLGLQPPAEDFEFESPLQNPLKALCKWYGQTAILIQQAVNHRVEFTGFALEGDTNQAWVFIEYEESTVAEQAAALALDIINASLAGTGTGDNANIFESRLCELRKTAGPLVLPIDTEMLINAAKTLDIPCFKLDRDPYVGVQNELRILNNGMLRLGHSRYQQILDGNLCFSRSEGVLAQMQDRKKILQLMQTLGLPIPVTDTRSANCNSLGRAARSAGWIGYPVVIKPVISKRNAVTTNIHDAAELEQAVLSAQLVTRQLVIESHVKGNSYKIISAGQQILSIVDVTTGKEITCECHESIYAHAARLAEYLPVGMLVMTVVTDDLSVPLEDSGGAFVNFNGSPELDRFLIEGEAIHRQAAETFIRWIFPEGSTARIPLFAVTGSNGKTTTCRMLAAISKTAGYKAGLACTEGVYINDNQIKTGDSSGACSHLRIFESTEADLAVLETARGGILTSGLIFDFCDVAICTNVTAEHLGEYGINTVEQMAALKLLVLQRARTAVVINADDEQCRRMVVSLGNKKVCLCSTEWDITSLEQQIMPSGCYCVLEFRSGEKWVVLYDAGQRNDVMPLKNIPAVFGGAARHNVSNAMQAIAAALLMGNDLAEVRSAMSSFAMGFDNTPGRLSFYPGLPFSVLLDFVQNIDGMRTLSRFIGTLDVKGKKILIVSVLGRHKNEMVKTFAQHVATNFDYFICRDYGTFYDREPGEIPRLLSNYLLESGVDSSAISIIQKEHDAIDAALNMARKGDLLTLMCGTKPHLAWRQFSEFERSLGES